MACGFMHVYCLDCPAEEHGIIFANGYKQWSKDHKERFHMKGGDNMTDTFRKTYTPLTDEQKSQMQAVKEKAAELEQLYNEAITPENGREIAIGKTNLEQSVMWAVKGITA